MGCNVGLNGAIGFGLKPGLRSCCYSGLIKGCRCLSILAPLLSTTITHNGLRRRSSFGTRNCCPRCLRKGLFAQFLSQRAGFRPHGWSLRAQGASATWWICGRWISTWRFPGASSKLWTCSLFCRGKMMWVCRLICSLGIMHLVLIWRFNSLCAFKLLVSTMFILPYRLV
jgi:hypothetical protein